MDQNWDAAGNRAAVSKQLRIVQCPSAPPNRVGISGAAAADYGAFNGIATELANTGLVDVSKVPVPHESGCMYKNSRVRMRDIRDGLTQTMMVAEDAGRPQEYGPMRTLVNSGQVVTGAGWADRQNLFALHGSTPDGRRWPGPCAVNCTNSNEIYSFHTGGANVLFADTTIRFLSTDTSIQTVAKMVTRNGDENVDY
jgi:prepilin-type processing-associated H-X9-DG protein